MSEGRPINLNQVVEIDGTAYSIMLFAPTRAIKLQVRLAKIIGQPMAEMAKAASGQNPLDLLPNAVRMLMERMDEGEVVSLIQDLLTCVTKDKKQINMDLEFHGRLGAMVMLLKKVIEVQFQDFQQALSASFQGVGAELTG